MNDFIQAISFVSKSSSFYSEQKGRKDVNAIRFYRFMKYHFLLIPIKNVHLNNRKRKLSFRRNTSRICLVIFRNESKIFKLHFNRAYKRLKRTKNLLNGFGYRNKTECLNYACSECHNLATKVAKIYRLPMWADWLQLRCHPSQQKT